MQTNLSAQSGTSLVLALLLAACGGGGGGETGPGSQPNAQPVDERISLSQYLTQRTAPPQAQQAQALQASDFRFASTAHAASDVAGSNALLLPGLEQSRRALLMAAAQGETLAELQAQQADPQGLAAGVQQRELQALSSSRFRPGFLQSTEHGHPQAMAPQQWRAISLTDWGTQAPASLRIQEHIELDLRWPAGVQGFEGVFEDDSGERRLKPMWRIAGPVWRLDEAGFTARGLNLADGTRLVSLTPSQGGLRAFAQTGLDAALLLVHQRLRAGVAAQTGNWVLAQRPPSFKNLQSGASLARAGDPARAQLGALDGSPQQARLIGPFTHLSWTQTGLSISGSQTLEFIPLAGTASQGGGSVTEHAEPPFDGPVACPPGEAAAKPMLLLVIDARLRLIALAQVASQGEAGQLCER